MCYNIAYLEKRAAKLAGRYINVIPPDWKNRLAESELPQYYFVSGFAHPELPVVTPKGVFIYRWGLIPFWVKDGGKARDISQKTLNAVGATVFEKPSFRRGIISGRCLLPVSGFFEWRHEGGKKLPYFIKSSEQEVFSLGCVSDTWTDPETGEVINTFSIVTTPANEMMEYIHNNKKRMPLVVRYEDEWSWVDPELEKEHISALIKPCEEGMLRAWRVSPFVNSSRNERNVPAALEPI